MEKHYVLFYAPGTLVAETHQQEISSWDPREAQSLAATIKMRHGAGPYGFRFLTRTRNEEALDSEITAASGMYFLPHCKLETYEDVVARDDPAEEILRTNMRNNDIKLIVTTTVGWKASYPFQEGDVLLKADA